MYYFKVKIGFKDDEFLGVDENEVEIALRAQITGRVAVLKSGTVSGNHIISITPDYQKEMGWAHDYHLTGEDMLEIGNEKVEEYRNFLAEKKGKVYVQLGTPIPEDVKQIEAPATEIKGRIDEERRVFVME